MSTTRHTEEEFQSLLRRLNLALAASDIGVWEHNLRTNFVTWDERMHKLYATGIDTTSIPAEIWANALHPDDLVRATAEFLAAIRNGDNYESEFRIIWPNGETRHLRSKASYYVTAEGDPAYIGMEWDVTKDVLLNRELETQRRLSEERASALQKSQAQVEYAADHDYLTGLRNRRSFDRYCDQVCADENVQQLAVMHIDLDRFKDVNDQHGHAAGDAILQVAARAIQEASRPGDFAARMGGDEFILMAVNFGTEEDLRHRAEAILATMARGTDLSSGHFAVGASIGIAWNTSRDIPALLRQSDQALYEAKRLGRNRLSFFTPELDERSSGCRRLADELKDAIGTQAIRPYYQPAVDARGHAIRGLEALVRWHHPTRGILMPEEILPLARECGEMAALDRHMLDCVIADQTRWQGQGRSVPTIWLNLSEERLRAAGLLEELRALRLPKGQIGFEVRMTAMMGAAEGILLARLRDIRQLGFEVAACGIDGEDTSLIALMRVRPDRIKLDAGLIWPLVADQEQLQLLHGLVKFAHSLGMTVTAEGVQSADHAEVLKNLGIDLLQGFGFGLPQPYEQVPLDSLILKRDLKG